MALEVTCPGCGARTLVPESARGSWGRCPRCRQPVQVPAVGAATNTYDGAAAAGAKVCIVCRKDLRGQKRIKDPQGRYYCESCYAARITGKNLHGTGGSLASPTAALETSPLAPQGELSQLVDLLPTDLQPLAPIEAGSLADAGVMAVAPGVPPPAARSEEQFCSRCGQSDTTAPLVFRDGKYICAECESFLFRGEQRQAAAQARQAERARRQNPAGFSRTSRPEDRATAPDWLATILTMLGCLVALAVLQLIVLGLTSAFNPKLHIWAHPDAVGGYVGVLSVGQYAGELLLIACLVLLRPLSPNADYGDFKTMVIKATVLTIAMDVAIIILVIVAAVLVGGVVFINGRSGSLVSHGVLGVILLLLMVVAPPLIYFWLVRKLFGAGFLTTFLALLLEVVGSFILVLVLGLPLALIASAFSHSKSAQSKGSSSSSVTPTVWHSIAPGASPTRPLAFPPVTPPAAPWHIRQQPVPALVVPEPVRVPAPGYWSTARLSRPCDHVVAVTAGHDALFYVGGSNMFNAPCHVDIYNAHTGRWSSNALPLPYTVSIYALGASVGSDAVFLTGGFLYLFDSRTGRWWATRSPADMVPVMAAAGHDVLLVAASGPQQRETVHIFNTLKRTWSQARLSADRSGFATTTAGHCVLFAGGSNMVPGGRFPRMVPSNAVDIFNSTTGRWSVARLAQPRTNCAATAAGHDALFAGGSSAMLSNMVDIFNATGARQSTARLSLARYDIIAASVGDKALFAGGEGPFPTDRVDIFDARTGTWSVSRLSVARCNSAFNLAATATVGNCALFAGGTARPGNSVDIFNARTGDWSVSHLSQARENPAAAAVGNQAIFAGGFVQQKNGLRQPSNVVDIFHYGHRSPRLPPALPGHLNSPRATRVTRIGPCQVWVKGNQGVTSYYRTANGQRSFLQAMIIVVAVKNTSQRPVAFTTWRGTPKKFQPGAPFGLLDRGIAIVCKRGSDAEIVRFVQAADEPRGFLWNTRTIQPGRTIYDAVLFDANPSFKAPFRLLLPTQNVGHSPAGFVWLKVPVLRAYR